MPVVRLSAMSFLSSASLRARSFSRSISSEMSSRDWPYLIAPAFACAWFHSRSPVSVFAGADGPSDFSQMLKSRFMPYLKLTEQPASFPLACSAPEQKSQAAKLSAGLFAARLDRKSVG